MEKFIPNLINLLLLVPSTSFDIKFTKKKLISIISHKQFTLLYQPSHFPIPAFAPLARKNSFSISLDKIVFHQLSPHIKFKLIIDDTRKQFTTPFASPNSYIRKYLFRNQIDLVPSTKSTPRSHLQVA